MDSKDRISLRFLAQPQEVNFGGNVHGGSVMSWIDQAGYACAAAWSKSYCVTVYVGGIRFFKPIQIGDLVECRARLIHTGTTSMHIAIDVFSGDPKSGSMSKTTHCVIVFVAVDEKGSPTEVPDWTPQTSEDQQLEKYAKRLIELRKGIDQEMNPYLDQEAV